MNPKADDDARLDLIAPWMAKASRKIKSTVEAASAHAEKALTRSAIGAPDGRRTWRTLKGQVSHNAAQERLDELCQYLVGSTATSLSGLVQDARAHFYVKAFGYWNSFFRNSIPDMSAILDPKAAPTKKGENSARGLLLWDKPVYLEIQPTFTTAETNLMATLNAAASQNVTPKQRADMIDSWEIRTKKAMNDAVLSIMSNSEVAISTMVGRDMIKPELRANSGE